MEKQHKRRYERVLEAELMEIRYGKSESSRAGRRSAAGKLIATTSAY